MGRSVRTLQTVNRPEHVACPLTQTWDDAIAVRDAVCRVPGFKVFIIPVLLLTDTAPNQTIEEWATQRRVKVLFGADDLVGPPAGDWLTRWRSNTLPLPVTSGMKWRP